MEWLNYHHLLYFYTVAREGGVARAAEVLRVSHPTVSAQVHLLEESLGELLLEKQGRKLVLTPVGKVVYGYAEEIFSTGRELLGTLKGRPTGKRPRVVVGIAEAVPKLVAKRILEPVIKSTERFRIVCREGAAERLELSLGEHAVDVVISDAPLSPTSAIRAYSHLLGECGITIFAAKDLAQRLRRGFPGSLHGAPLLLPGSSSALRKELDRYFEANGFVPEVEAEFDDSALLKVFGQDGAGAFAVPSAIEALVKRQYGVSPVGRIPEVRERFYAISPERRLRNPAVVLLTERARERLFAETS
jgi:LysR family transcriptional regulator, transcriptional activator of nhaA